MAKLSKKLKSHITRFAVSYRAYGAAVQNQDQNGIIVWGQMLLDAQEVLDIEISNPIYIKDAIAQARQFEAA